MSVAKRPFMSLRIAGKLHKVKWGVDLEGDCGLMEFKPLRISVGRDMAPDEERESLLHEVMHAIEYQQGLELKEDQIRQLSIGLFEVLRNNPKLAHYLLEEDEEDGSP